MATYSDVMIDTSRLNPNLDITHADTLRIVSLSEGLLHHLGYPVDMSTMECYTLEKWYNKPVNTSIDKTTLNEHICISLIQVWNDTFQHIPFDTFSKITAIEMIWKTNPDAMLIVNNKLQAKMCSAFWNISADKFIVVPPNVSYITKHLYYPNFISSSGTHTKMGSSGYGILHRFVAPPEACDTVVYLSRQGLPKRIMSNEDDVYLTTLLNEIVSKHSLSMITINNPKTPDEVIPIMRRAKLVVSIHGGAVSNIIHSNKSTHVLEIISDVGLKERPCFYYLTNSLGLKYHQHIPTHFDFGGYVTLNKITIENDIIHALES